ncbi:MAG: hypothetical protein ISR51_03290 [Rhodospirillales bacterium]|nr:hypothetical protein [Alphaproteobacteria bacterium]MBL6947678.1 hypothetical protein [Rhodospirillales bacterium]
MIDLQKIKSLGVGSSQIEFTEFLIDEKGDESFPDYRKLDLMKVPKLVPYTWVVDFRNGIDDGLLFHFSGTKIDYHYGYCITGRKMEEFYTGIYWENLFHCFRQVYLQKKIAYTTRLDEYNEHGNLKKREVETLLFPCSEDGRNINFGIGISNFTFGIENFEPTFAVL